MRFNLGFEGVCEQAGNVERWLSMTRNSSTVNSCWFKRINSFICSLDNLRQWLIMHICLSWEPLSSPCGGLVRLSPLPTTRKSGETLRGSGEPLRSQVSSSVLSSQEEYKFLILGAVLQDLLKQQKASQAEGTQDQVIETPVDSGCSSRQEFRPWSIFINLDENKKKSSKTKQTNKTPNYSKKTHRDRGGPMAQCSSRIFFKVLI